MSVILHLDLDCYYAQVEEQRLGLTGSGRPLAVLQWSNLIAVNYEAKKCGVKRSVTAEEARKLCSDIVLAHVATLTAGDTRPVYREAHQVDITTHKASLDSYRAASARIMALIAAEGYLFQRAGTDECFLDVTTKARAMAAAEAGKPCDWTDLGLVLGEAGHELPEGKGMEEEDDDEEGVEVDSPDDDDAANETNDGEEEDMPEEETDRVEVDEANDALMRAGAVIASQIRAKLWNNLKFRASAGIAPNKLLAKLGSALNKPNGQAVVRLAYAPILLRQTRLRKIPQLGGKLGSLVEKHFGVGIMAGDAALQSRSRGQMRAILGEDAGSFVYNAVRGIGSTKVKENDKVKSIMAAKNVGKKVDTRVQMVPWLDMLAVEVGMRCAADESVYGRRALRLNVYFRHASKTSSRGCRMPGLNAYGCGEAIARAARAVLEQVPDAELFPCGWLALSASQFVDVAHGKASIEHFFAGGSGDKQTEGGEQPCVGGEEGSRCGECGATVPLGAEQEHSDMHMARNLLRQERQDRLKRARPVSSSDKSKGGRGGGGGGASVSSSSSSAPKRPCIENFFKKKGV